MNVQYATPLANNNNSRWVDMSLKLINQSLL